MDLHVMVFVGFGFLYVFLRAHSWTSLAFNWLAGSWAFLIGILWIGFWMRVLHSNFEDNMIKLDIKMLVEGNFCAASILIAYGAVLGKLNAYQLLWMATVQACFYSLNLALCDSVYGSTDPGGTIYIHLFGGAFGVFTSWVYRNPRSDKD